jgi:hypothetical protein
LFSPDERGFAARQKHGDDEAIALVFTIHDHKGFAIRLFLAGGPGQRKTAKKCLIPADNRPNITASERDRKAIPCEPRSVNRASCYQFSFGQFATSSSECGDNVRCLDDLQYEMLPILRKTLRIFRKQLSSLCRAGMESHCVQSTQRQQISG